MFLILNSICKFLCSHCSWYCPRYWDIITTLNINIYTGQQVRLLLSALPVTVLLLQHCQARHQLRVGVAGQAGPEGVLSQSAQSCQRPHLCLRPASQVVVVFSHSEKSVMSVLSELTLIFWLLPAFISRSSRDCFNRGSSATRFFRSEEQTEILALLHRIRLTSS